MNQEDEILEEVRLIRLRYLEAMFLLGMIVGGGLTEELKDKIVEYVYRDLK